jgi:hypothetical protein
MLILGCVFVEFDLASNRFTEMKSIDDSATEEEIGDACLTALAHAHDPNPALRRPDQFFSFLEYTSDCNLTELQFMLVSSRESPIITRKVALKMQVRLLKFIGKLKLHARWPNFWSRVAHDFDRAFAAHVAGSVVSDAIRFSFVKGLQNAFEPFVAFRHFETVEKALASKQEVPVEAMRPILATNVGALLYKGEGLKLRYQQYVATINDRLRQLEDLAYAPEDVQAFKDVMSQEARVVLERSATFERKPCEFVFMEATMRIKISDINDEWGVRLEARARTQAVSQKMWRASLGR